MKTIIADKTNLLFLLTERSSQPSSSVVSINLESLPPPPPHILNPFLNPTPPSNAPPPLPSLPTASPNPASASCRHAPGVSTFCNSTCCQASPQPSPPVPHMSPSVLPVIEEAQKIYDSLPDSTFFLPPENLQLMERLGEFFP